MRLRLSTETGSAARLVGDCRAIEYIKRAGFDAYDFTMLEMRDRYWASALDGGISFLCKRAAEDSG